MVESTTSMSNLNDIWLLLENLGILSTLLCTFILILQIRPSHSTIYKKVSFATSQDTAFPLNGLSLLSFHTVSLYSCVIAIIGSCWHVDVVCFRWFCHVDDDTYVNIPQLVNLLQEYNHSKEWYLGKPSLSHPIEIRDPDRPGVSTSNTINLWPSLSSIINVYSFFNYLIFQQYYFPIFLLYL